jgi:hypothetical protein
LCTAQGCCCPADLYLDVLRAVGYTYVGYEAGHTPACRFNNPIFKDSYGLEPIKAG